MQTSIVSIIFLSVFLGFAPVFFYSWFFFLRRKKRFQMGKQPTALLITMFFGGIGSVVLSYFAERFLIGFLPPEFGLCVANSPACQSDNAFTIWVLFSATFFIVGPVEEGGKWLAAYFISSHSPKFTRIIDGVKYGVAVGLGFAAAENALYLFNSLRVLDLNSFVSTFLLRFAISTLAHILYSGIFGYYIGKAQFQRYGRVRTYATGLILAIVTHGLFDFVLFSQVGFYAIILLALMFGVVIYRFKAPENYAVRIPEFIRKKPAAQEKAYVIPVEQDLAAAQTGYQNIYAEISPELRPLPPKQFKKEFIPDEVPSEFAKQIEPELTKKKLKLPEETVPTRQVRPQPSIARNPQPLSVSGAKKIVDSSVARVKKQSLQINPQ